MRVCVHVCMRHALRVRLRSGLRVRVHNACVYAPTCMCACTEQKI